MKKIILIIMSLLTFSCSSKAQEQTMNASRQSEKKILVACLSAINAENQQIIKQTPNFTPKNVKLGVFILFKTNHIRSENNLIKNRTNEKNNQFIFRKISYLCSK